MVRKPGGDYGREFASRLRQMRAALGLSQGKIAALIGGYRTDTWSRLERGDASGVSLDLLLDLAAWTARQGISLDWLLSGVEPMRLKPQPAAPVVSDARSGPEPRSRGRHPRGRPFAVKRVLRPGYELCPAEALPSDWRGKWVPILGRIAAGAGIDTVAADQHPTGLADKFVRWSGKAARPFAAEVVGESMTPDYKPGDLVISDGDRPCISGVSCVIFDEKGERLVRLKRLHISGRRVVLESLNRAFPAVELEPGRFIAAYEIVAHLSLAVPE